MMNPYAWESISGGLKGCPDKRLTPGGGRSSPPPRQILPLVSLDSSVIVDRGD